MKMASHKYFFPKRISFRRKVWTDFLDFIYPLVLFLLLIFLWNYITENSIVASYLLPNPKDVLLELVNKRSLFLKHTWITLQEALFGFLIAATLGILLAIGISQNRILERTIFPYVVMAKVIPIVSIAPFLTLWLGFGMEPKIVISALISFFPIVINTVKGLRSVDPQVLRFMRSIDASPWQTLYKIKLPFALPFMFASFRVSIALCVVGAIVGELVGADQGLGYLMTIAEAYLDSTLMFASVVVSAILGLILFSLIGILENCFLSWHPSTQDINF